MHNQMKLYKIDNLQDKRNMALGYVFFVFLLLSLSSCSFFSADKIISDPTEVDYSVSRDQGLVGRAKFLSNSIFPLNSKRANSTSSAVEQAKIPINPVCLPAEGKGDLPSGELAKFVLMLKPSDGRAWSHPIKIKSVSSIMTQQLTVNRGFDVDLSSVPDGRYHLVLCDDEKECRFSLDLKKGSTDNLSAKLFEKKSLRYQYNTEKWIFAVAGYQKFLQNNLMSNPHVFAVGANIWIEQGLIVWPESKFSYWNGRVYSLPSQDILNQDYFVDQKSSAPVLHMWFGQPKNNIPKGFCYPELSLVLIDTQNSELLVSSPKDGVEISSSSTSWPKTETTGALAIDFNKNGKIDGFSELISSHHKQNNHADSIQSLFDLDSNKDNIFDDDDEMYEFSSLWFDRNQDGVIGQDEISKLSKINIESISMRVAPILESDQYGNSSFYRTVATTSLNDRLLMVYSIRLQSFGKETLSSHQVKPQNILSK
jgi:hypothetical protein